MPQFESESLVLRSYNLAEADRIVVFLTREHGIVRGVAKGAKRLKSRFGSTLEPFSNVDLTFFQKEDRELVSIQQIELNRSAFESASHPEFLEAFAYLADLLIAFMPPHDPNEKIFRMTNACLEASIDRPTALAAVRLYFELWLLRLGGYLPDWGSCRNCNRALENTENVFLTQGFHLVCQNCSSSRQNVQVTPIQRELFHGVLRLAPLAFIDHANLNPKAVIELSSILRRIISQVLGRDLTNPAVLAVRS